VSCDKPTNILVRVLSVIRHGRDPNYECVEEKFDRIEADLRRMNGLADRRGPGKAKP